MTYPTYPPSQTSSRLAQWWTKLRGIQNWSSLKPNTNIWQRLNTDTTQIDSQIYLCAAQYTYFSLFLFFCNYTQIFCLIFVWGVTHFTPRKWKTQLIDWQNVSQYASLSRSFYFLLYASIVLLFFLSTFLLTCARLSKNLNGINMMRASGTSLA